MSAMGMDPMMANVRPIYSLEFSHSQILSKSPIAIFKTRESPIRPLQVHNTLVPLAVDCET